MYNLRKSIFLGLVGLLIVMGAGAGIVSAQYDYVSTWGSHGTNAGQFDFPRGIAVDQTGNVYVIDGGNNRAQVFSSDGKFLRQWGSYGSGDGQFDMPFGILSDKSRVYVTDSNNNRVQVFTLNGNYITEWDTGKVLGECPSGSDTPFMPYSICVNSSGYFFVGGNGGIKVYSPKMQYITALGSFGTGDNQIQAAYGLAVNSTGYLYVADTINNRIQVLSPDNIFVTRFGTIGSDPGKFIFPLGLAIDNEDFIFVADSNNNRIQVLDPSGTFLAMWGSLGTDPGKFDFVTGIAISTSKIATGAMPEYIYITDLRNDRVQVFVIEDAPVILTVDPVSGKSGAKNQRLAITGSEFLVGCTVRLEKSGTPAITARILGTPFSNRITSTINLNGATKGSWDVVVVNPGGAEGRLENGFLVK